MTMTFVATESEVHPGVPDGTTTPAIDRVVVGHGRVTSRTLIGSEVRSSFAGPGMLDGIALGVSGTASCRGAKSGFVGTIGIRFIDARGVVVARWRGAHAGRQVDDAGSLVTHAAGLLEVTSAAAPALRALGDQSALAEIRVTAGEYGITMWLLVGRHISRG
jgi:hypothetical protein